MQPVSLFGPSHRILVCGSRTWHDRELLESTLDKAAQSSHPKVTVISGGAAGADSMARQWAHSRGHEFVEILPDWDRFGRRAGILRNKDMMKCLISTRDPDDRLTAIGFRSQGPSKGTDHMLSHAISEADRNDAPVHVMVVTRSSTDILRHART